MPTLNARLITRNDWDFKWEESQLVLQPGELAISIPTKEAAQGDEVIPGSVTQENPSGRTPDPLKDLVIKIGNRDTFYTNGRINGTNGVLVNLADTGTFDSTMAQPVLVAKDQQTGKTVISVREAHATAFDQQTGEVTAALGGVISDTDYKDFSNLADFFRDEHGNLSAETISEKTMSEIQTDDSLEFDEHDQLGVSANIIWQCND